MTPLFPPGTAKGRPRAQPASHESACFAALLRLEMRTTLGVRHLAMLVLMSVIGLVAFWLPTFPETVFRFFNRVFHLSNWAEIVFANDLTGLFFFVYWMGVFDVLTIVVVPREERYLDLFLSKPLSRRGYMLARLLPILAKATGIGTIAAAFHWGALVAADLPYDALAFFGASVATIGWAVFLVAVVNLLVVGTRDSYSAVLIAFVPIVVSMFPGMIYMYRPDVFVGMPMLRDVIVFPMNLVWYKGLAAHWGAVFAGLMLCLAAVLAGVAASRIERRDSV